MTTPLLPDARTAPQGGVVRPSLLLLTATTFVTWIGTRLTAVALPLVALQETGEPWTMGLVGGAAGLPLLTVAWWGRRVRDRLTTGRALAVVMALNAVGMALVPAATSSGHLGATVLGASGLVTGAAAALLGPAERSLVSDLADEHVRRGGRTGPARWLAWQNLAHRVSMVFAPPAAAWAVTVWGAAPLLWCETVVVGVAAVALLAVPGVPAPAQDRIVPAAVRGVSAVAVLRRHPDIAAGVAMAGVAGACWFGFSLGLTVLGTERGRPGQLLAAGMSGYGLASVLASLVVPFAIQRVPQTLAMSSAWLTLGGAFVLLPLAAPSLVGVACAAAVGGAATPWGIAALNAAISSRTHGADRRAAFTAETVLHSGGTSVGLLLGGAVIGWVGAGTVLVAAGTAQAVAAVVGAGWARRATQRGAWTSARRANVDGV